MTASIPPTNNALRLPSIVDPSTQQIIKRGRVKSPADLKSAWDSLWWADLDSAQQRARAQQWRGGMPPYSARKEALMGTAGRTNVNWGLGDQIALDAEMPYNDILDSVDTLFSMPTNWGTPDQRVYVEQVMAEEITRMLRNWSQFDPLYQLNVRLFVDEGVSFAFFEDDFVWKWDVVGLQHLVFARRVKADIEQVGMIVAKRQLLPYKLYEKCANKDLSASEGWDREATWQAIKTAAQPTLSGNDFQEWEVAWKNHDYIFGQTEVTVEVIEGWVREVDGTVSHYIGRSDGQGDFLYKKEGKYKSMSRMLCPFLYGVGANGTFHSIHGVLQKTFGPGMAQNKVFNRALDMAIHASTPYLICNTEEAVTELPLTPMGQYVAMAPGYGWGETKVPNFESGLLPVLDYLGSFLQARSSPYANTMKPVQGKTPKTKYQQQSEDDQNARLSSSGVTLFKSGLTSLYREVVRRVIQDPYPQSWDGGAEVQEFLARCIDRQVPIEAIRQVDVKRVEVNMGIGRGSSAARRVSADALNILYPRADAKGQNLINYLVASSYSNADTARAIFPFEPGLRPPQDYEDATNENASIVSTAALGLPSPIHVLPTQNDAVHLDVHIPYLEELNGMIIPEDANSLPKIIPLMGGVLTHAEEHVAEMDATDGRRTSYQQALGKFRMVVTNGLREIQRLQESAMREAEHNGTVPGEDGQQGVSPAMLIQSAAAAEKARSVKVDTELRVAKHEMDQAREASDSVREDALAAAKILTMGSKN